ncbi:lysozyme [Thioclava sp. NG1]|uniref:lysozyme n=1 Tax=Thioclava sp. NG1 TaxID=2182426 RepID=UPI000D6218B8|nr:lysozyme [Thioclava sp. NG1]PWE48494.1 lysozyme [Thioclava sp. NG1]
MMIPEWKLIATKAWSFLFSIANAIFLAAAAGWETFAPEDLHLKTSTYLMVGAMLAAVTGGSRLIQQQKLAEAIAAYLAEQGGAISKKAAAAIMAAVLAVGVPLTAKWEGKENTAYRDVIGVLTVCYGETRGVKAGDTYTDAECTAMLQSRWAEFYTGMLQIAPPMQQAPIEVQAAVTSWAYNVGLGNAAKSTLAKKLRARDWRAACNELPKWTRSGERFLQGLLNRRLDERKLCLSGLK